MGRRNNTTEISGPPVKFRLQKLRWVGGDYDEGGAYWGYVRGENIYWARGEGEEEVQEMFVRATSRQDAKDQVCELFPDAIFLSVRRANEQQF